MEYIKAMRPVMGIFSSLLCLAAINLQAPTFAQEHPFRVICLLIAVFCGTSATMVWNDFSDRNHDLKKGKRHALDNRYSYATFARWLWIICASCSVWAADGGQTPWLMLGVFMLCMIGIYYPSTYQIPYLSMVLVGIASASPTLFALFLPEPRSLLWGVALFVDIVVTICAREILKDIEDREIDDGYKLTVPVRWGVARARLIAALLLVAGAAPVAILTYGSTLALLPVCMVVCSMIIFWSRRPEVAGKWSIDVGTVALLVSLYTVPVRPW